MIELSKKDTRVGSEWVAPRRNVPYPDQITERNLSYPFAKGSKRVSRLVRLASYLTTTIKHERTATAIFPRKAQKVLNRHFAWTIANLSSTRSQRNDATRPNEAWNEVTRAIQAVRCGIARLRGKVHLVHHPHTVSRIPILKVKD